MTAYPEGETTAARYVATAAEYGFDGVVVRTRAAASGAEDLRATAEIDVATGVEIDADDPASASGAVGNFRPDHDVVIVRGGTPELNRFAVEQDRVDVLATPMRGDGDFNHVLAKAARDNRTHVEVNLGPVLRRAGGDRVQHLQALRKLRELLTYYDAPFVVSARAESHLQLRAPRELVAVGQQVGFEPDAVRRGLAAWGAVVRESRRRRSESFITPGVTRGRYEEDDR
ncbi:RNase P subunit p30 family protein [Halobaculum sp. MBLA0147]|uniref:RNase P subunit p30 family protein n=1 Tax=Halobaculum sp. MBLA0147 TaxID=3079934 RepID=UPI003524DED4